MWLSHRHHVRALPKMGARHGGGAEELAGVLVAGRYSAVFAVGPGARNLGLRSGADMVCLGVSRGSRCPVLLARVVAAAWLKGKLALGGF